MFGTFYNMLNSSSPRPTKRQKTGQETPKAVENQVNDTRTTRSARRDVSRALPVSISALKRDAGLRDISGISQPVSDSENVSTADFIDSAYQSMGASPDYANGDEELSEHIQTPSKQPIRLQRATHRESATKAAETDSRLGREIKPSSKSTNQELGTSMNEEEDKARNLDNDEDNIMVRLSGRTRTKTWKSAEVETAEQLSTTSFRTSRNGGTSTPQPTSLGVKHTSSTRRPVAALSTSETPTKGSLRMPRPRGRILNSEEVVQDETAIITTKKPKPSHLMANGKTGHGTPKKPKNKTVDISSEAMEGDPNVVILPHIPQSHPERETWVELLKENKYDEVIAAMKMHIIEHLTCSGPLPLCGEGHALAYQKVYQVLEQTVTAGEGNSMLLIGARGTAKTTIIETALTNLTSEFKDHFHTIRLNGFLHTDDKLALKEIWRQLGKEMAVEDSSMNDRTNYADTMTSLLALLSQPEELPALESNRTTSKSVIFILDEFDLFTTHPRQTLLYNLFDIAQSRKAPIAVLGSTTRIDIVESLEKRVKSRFSHRYVHVSYPKTFSAYLSIIRAFLMASSGEESQEVHELPALKDLQIQYSGTFQQIYQAWSAYISHLLSDPSILLVLSRQYNQTKSPQAFLNAFLLPIRRLPVLPQTADLLLNSFTPPDSNLHLLPSLSDASLALLIAAARLDIICDTDTVTFNMAYDEYVRLAQRSRLVASASGMIAVSGSTSGGSKGMLGRDVALAAWERLEEVRLLLPVAGQGGQTQGDTIDLGRGGRLVRVDVGLEEIGSTPGLELRSMSKWCKEI